jgi:hypothetical protein
MNVGKKLPVRETRVDIVFKGKELIREFNDTNLGSIYGVEALPGEIYQRLVWFEKNCPWRISPKHRDAITQYLKSPTSDHKEFYCYEYGRQVLTFALSGVESFKTRKDTVIEGFPGLVQDYSIKKYENFRLIQGNNKIDRNKENTSDKQTMLTLAFSREEPKNREIKKLIQRITPEELFNYTNSRSYF